MKKNVFKIIAAFLALALLVGSCVVTGYGYVRREALALYSGISTTYEIDWDKFDPADPETSVIPKVEEGQKNGDSLIDRLHDTAVYLINQREVVTDKIQKYCTTSLPIREWYLYLSGKTASLAGMKSASDAELTCYQLKNGYLADKADKIPNVAEHPSTKNVIALNTWLGERNIPLVYLLTADKSDETFAEFPNGIHSYYKENAEAFQKAMKENGVSVLDAGDVLLSENPDFFSWFYKTDHHWNIRAGLTVAGALAQKLQSEFALPIRADLLEPELYESKEYKDFFLGSYGKKAKIGYAYPEDFEILSPNFETQYTVQIPTSGFMKTGSFDVLYDGKMLEKKHNDVNAYGSFMYGDRALIHVENKLADNDTRIVFIKLSKANVITPFMAGTVRYTDIIDPRHFSGDVHSIIEKLDPDAVVMVLGPCDNHLAQWNLD